MDIGFQTSDCFLFYLRVDRGAICQPKFWGLVFLVVYACAFGWGEQSDILRFH